MHSSVLAVMVRLIDILVVIKTEQERCDISLVVYAQGFSMHAEILFSHFLIGDGPPVLIIRSVYILRRL